MANEGGTNKHESEDSLTLPQPHQHRQNPSNLSNRHRLCAAHHRDHQNDDDQNVLVHPVIANGPVVSATYLRTRSARPALRRIRTNARRGANASHSQSHSLTTSPSPDLHSRHQPLTTPLAQSQPPTATTPTAIARSQPRNSPFYSADNHTSSMSSCRRVRLFALRMGGRMV